MDNTAKKVAVIMGSDSDLPAVKPAIDKLKSFGVPVEAHVMSAHRTPALAADFAANARKNGFGDIIATIDTLTSNTTRTDDDIQTMLDEAETKIQGYLDEYAE